MYKSEYGAKGPCGSHCARRGTKQSPNQQILNLYEYQPAPFDFFEYWKI